MLSDVLKGNSFFFTGKFDSSCSLHKLLDVLQQDEKCHDSKNYRTLEPVHFKLQILIA